MAVTSAVQRLAQIQTVPAVAHDDAQQQRRFAVIAHHEGGRIFVAALHRGDVGQLQRAPLRHDGRVADLLQLVERAVEADEDLRPAASRPSRPGVKAFWPFSAANTSCAPHAQGRQALMRKLDEDAFGLLADDIDLLHARHVQQPLAQGFRLAHQQALRLALGLQRIQRKGDVGVFVVDHRADHAGRQIGRLVAQLLARLVELVLHLGGRRAVEQGQRREGQARARCRSRPGRTSAAPAGAFRSSRPPGPASPARVAPGQAVTMVITLTVNGRIFRAPQLEERQQAGQRNEADQEQGDGTLAHGQRRQIEAGRAHGRAPATAAAGACSTLTCSPWRSRWAPSATMRSPAFRPSTSAPSSCRPLHLHGPPGHLRRRAADHPHALPLARVMQGRQRYLHAVAGQLARRAGAR